MKERTINKIAWYSIFLGSTVLAMWVFLLMNDFVSEGLKEMIFHLVSEVIMAFLCIAGGVNYIKRRKSIILIAAHAMVVYSVLNAAGYYFEKGETIVTAVFGILLLLSVICLIYLNQK